MCCGEAIPFSSWQCLSVTDRSTTARGRRPGKQGVCHHHDVIKRRTKRAPSPTCWRPGLGCSHERVSPTLTFHSGKILAALLVKWFSQQSVGANDSIVPPAKPSGSQFANEGADHLSSQSPVIVVVATAPRIKRYDPLHSLLQCPLHLI